MNWNYIGIDDDPPSGKIMMLTSDGSIMLGQRGHPYMVAWHPIVKPNLVKAQCQEILRGLPELKMVGCICKDVELTTELVRALASYSDDRLSEFTDFIRTLDRRAHSGICCIPNFHR